MLIKYIDFLSQENAPLFCLFLTVKRGALFHYNYNYLDNNFLTLTSLTAITNISIA